MDINSTSEYLKTLDDIADIFEKENLTNEEVKILNLKKLAVKRYEMKEVRKYPVTLALMETFKRNKFLLN
ncbi:MAG: hypothetical protein P8Q42_00265 [Flavobacteriales bacterium]|nr:hypothetical protein [Flavobacteriales bacterium]